VLSKCANPSCSNHFLYLHAGKVFRLEVDGREYVSGVAGGFRKATRKLEFFWLCDECAERFTVVYRKDVGVSLQEIHENRKLAS
jgi:hypothetical protein